MSPCSADRNLLFGILALQMEFINRGALMAGMNAWVLDKGKPIGEVLVQQGALLEEHRRLLEPLVDAHVKRHNNDPAQSLAALSSAGGGAEALRSIQDHQLQESLMHVGAAQPSAQTAPTLTHDGPSSFDQLRFRVLRPHARGGLGQVFVARDEELGRRVALKEIRNDKAHDPNLRSRFVLEAEINGNLEHPGIVPVYGLGTYPDGRPFYAMRFVEGDSLREAIARFHASGATRNRGEYRSLEFRQLLARFVDVCEAIAYAHSRGVLHRDLKPDNVMLGRYGETLVVDWGLAKTLGGRDTVGGEPTESALVPPSGDSHDPTLAGTALGTPAYMSPEQAEGRLDELGPATDVYALGATLHHLLTGRAPVEGEDLGDVLRRVIRGEIPPPRTLRSDVPRALEAVCRKAMALKPADRYQSAQALAEDIERWLADEPLAAYREPLLARMQRWGRKHRTLVTSAAAVSVVTALGAAFSAAQQNAHARAIESRNRQLQNALKNERQARMLAEDRKKLADENLSLALDAVRAQVFDIDNELRYLAGTRDLREKLQKSATQRLKQLTERTSARGDVDRTTWGAYVNLGDVYLFVDLKPTAARRQYELAHTIAERLAAADPDDTRTQRDLSLTYHKLGQVALRLGETAQALKYYNQKLEIAKALTAADPSDTEALRDLSIAYNQLGDITRQMGQPARALEYYTQSQEMLQSLAAANPRDAQLQRDLSVSYERIGDLTRRMGQPERALEYLTRGFDLRKALAAANPRDTQAQRDLAVAYENLGEATLQMGEPARALGYFEHSLAITQALAAANPRDAQAQRDLSISYDSVGEATLQMGEPARAMDYFSKGLAISQALAAADPHDAQAQRDLSISYNKLGEVALQMDEPPLALDSFTKGHEISQALAAADPRNAQAQRDLSISYNKLGDVTLQLGQPERALEHYNRGLVIRKALVTTDPRDAQAQRDLSLSYEKVGDASLKAGQPAAALENYNQSRAIVQALADANPTDAQTQTDLAFCYYQIGLTKKEMADYTDAIAQFRSGQSIVRKLHNEGRLASAYTSMLENFEKEIAQCEARKASTPDSSRSPAETPPNTTPNG